MAYTEADLAALRAAKASGARVVRYADGKSVEYRTLAEMERIEATIAEELTAPTGNVVPRRLEISTDRGFW